MASLKKEHQTVLDYSKQILSGEKKLDLSVPFGREYTERCVETPWAAEHLKGVKTLLDIGFTFASPEYLGLLLELKDRYGVELRAVDIIEPEKVKTRYPKEWLKSIMEVPVTIGDVRRVDLPKDHFDAVTIVSTIEHIGFDEPSRTMAQSAFERKLHSSEVNYLRDIDIDRQVLDNLLTALKKNGKLIITVPMGNGAPILTKDSLGYYTAEMEYDSGTWAPIIGHEGFRLQAQKFFKLSDEGWIEVPTSKDLEYDKKKRTDNRKYGCAVAVLLKR